MTRFSALRTIAVLTPCVPLLAALIALAGPTSASADDTSRLAVARQVVQDVHATDTMRQIVPMMLQQLKPMLKGQGADPKTVEDLIGRFQARIEPELGKFADLIAAIYAREFTEPQLTELDAFYTSPTGQALITKQPTIMQAMTTLGTQWGQNLAREVLQDYQRDRVHAATPDSASAKP